MQMDKKYLLSCYVGMGCQIDRRNLALIFIEVDDPTYQWIAEQKELVYIDKEHYDFACCNYLISGIYIDFKKASAMTGGYANLLAMQKRTSLDRFTTKIQEWLKEKTNGSCTIVCPIGMGSPINKMSLLPIEISNKTYEWIKDQKELVYIDEGKCCQNICPETCDGKDITKCFPCRMGGITVDINDHLFNGPRNNLKGIEINILKQKILEWIACKMSTVKSIVKIDNQV